MRRMGENAEVVGHVLRSYPTWGGVLYHGICGRCGQVEELTAAAAEAFQRTAACEVCVEDMAGEANEKRWYGAREA